MWSILILAQTVYAESLMEIRAIPKLCAAMTLYGVQVIALCVFDKHCSEWSRWDEILDWRKADSS